jgi:FkbM family methyltransferase
LCGLSLRYEQAMALPGTGRHGGDRERLARLEATTRRLLRDVESIKLGGAMVLEPNRAITSLASGDRIYFDPRDRGCGINLATEGKYEEDELRVLRRFLRPGCAFLDIGANYGYYSISAAPYVRPGGRIIGFEPNPHVHDLFASSIYVNGYRDVVEARRLGAYDREAVMSFEIDEASPGGARLLTAADRPGDRRLVIDVATVRLDDHLPADMVVDAVKIDVEGREAQVLDGMRAIVARSPAIVILMEWIYDFFADEAAFHRFASLVSDDLGLTVYRIASGGRLEETGFDALRGASCNLLLSARALAPMPDLRVTPGQLQRCVDAAIDEGVLTWRAPSSSRGIRTIAHGPYVHLPRGRYRIAIDGEFDGRFLFRLQENFGDLLAETVLRGAAGHALEVDLLLDAPRLEVAIKATARARSMSLRSVEFWPL